jgi:hypothetical protein
MKREEKRKRKERSELKEKVVKGRKRRRKNF